MTENTSVIVMAQAHASEENNKAARAIVESLIASTRVEAGCLQYELLTNIEDPNNLVLLEEWATPESLVTHNTNSESLAQMGQLIPLIDQAGSGLRLTRTSV